MDRLRSRLAIGIVGAASVAGCTGHARVTDTRAVLLESSERDDSDHPHPPSRHLTHFGYLGSVVTADGPVHVVDRRGVLTGMLAPRGQNAIVFFDRHLRYVGRVGYADSRPLWCEGSKVFLFGNLDGFNRPGFGNVIDLTAGFDSLRVYAESRYGSSGGLAD